MTGAAGFVGRHLVRRLLENGDEAHAVDCIAPYTGGIDPSTGWPLFDPRDHKNFQYTTSFEVGIKRALTYYSQPHAQRQPGTF